MRRYETTFISHPDLTDEYLEKLTQRAVDAIQQHHGEILQVQQWGKKKLAYKIKKQTRGNYTLLDYAAASGAVRELERILRLDDKVLKFLTVFLAESVDVEAVRRSLSEGQRPRAPFEEEAPPAAPASASEEAAPTASVEEPPAKTPEAEEPQGT